MHGNGYRTPTFIRPRQSFFDFEQISQNVQGFVERVRVTTSCFEPSEQRKRRGDEKSCGQYVPPEYVQPPRRTSSTGFLRSGRIAEEAAGDSQEQVVDNTRAVVDRIDCRGEENGDGK